jgi:hypothetical protein
VTGRPGGTAGLAAGAARARIARPGTRAGEGRRFGGHRNLTASLPTLGFRGPRASRKLTVAEEFGSVPPVDRLPRCILVAGGSGL